MPTHQDYFIDPNPTRTDNPIITDEEIRAFQETLTTPTDEPSALPSITEVEVAALRGVDVAEQVAEPINKFSAARAGIKLAAWVARKLR